MNEPSGWEQEPTATKRALRAVRAPTLAAATVLLVAVLIAVITVLGVPRDAVGVIEQTMPTVSFEQPVTATESMSVIVHVAGAVNEPGVVELDLGARVVDAIAAAGGVTGEAVLTQLNLARIIHDGEHIIVPDSVTAQAPESAVGDGRVNLNTASSAELESLPRIGPSLASRIIQWRETHGSFTAVEQLTQVSGVGPKVFAEIRDLVTIG